MVHFMVAPVKSQPVLQWQTFPLEKSNTDTEITPLLLCFVLYFGVNVRGSVLTRVLPALHMWDSGHSKHKEGHTVISLVSNPKSIRDGQNRGMNGTGVASTQGPGFQKCLLLPREGGWIKHLNVCPVVYCSIPSSWCFDALWCLCAKKCHLSSACRAWRCAAPTQTFLLCCR